MTSTDLKRLLQSDELQAALRPRKAKPSRRVVKKNPLKHIQVMLKLNPYAEVIKRRSHLKSIKAVASKKSAATAGGAKPAPATKKPAAVPTATTTQVRPAAAAPVKK